MFVIQQFGTFDWWGGDQKLGCTWFKRFLDQTPGEGEVNWENMIFGSDESSICAGGDGSVNANKCEMSGLWKLKVLNKNPNNHSLSFIIMVSPSPPLYTVMASYLPPTVSFLLAMCFNVALQMASTSIRLSLFSSKFSTCSCINAIRPLKYLCVTLEQSFSK